MLIFFEKLIETLAMMLLYLLFNVFVDMILMEICNLNFY